jgi:hypothetical protein
LILKFSALSNEQFFSYIMARTNYFQWNDDDVRFVLDQHAELNFYILLAHWNNSLRVDMSEKRIDGVMVSVLATSAVDHGFKLWSG